MAGAGATVPARGPTWRTGADLPRVRGRLAAEAMFPAGLHGYRPRFERLTSGERIRIVEVGPTSGSPVVFLGGWGCCAWDFNRTLAPVADAGFRAIALDVRGHGLSDMPSGDALYATDALIGFIVEAMDLLALPRVAVIGHSMGGALAVHLALRERQRVTAAVLISAVGFGDTHIAAAGRIATPRWILPVARVALQRSVLAAGLRMVYASSVHVDERNVDEYWAPSQFPGFVPAMRALLHRFRWSRFTRAEIEQVHAPCLLIRGGRDGVVRAPQPAMALPGNYRELVIPEAGHLPHDEAPERVNDAIVEFLRRHAAGDRTSPR